MASSVDVGSRVNGLRADFTKVSTLSAALKIASEATFLHRRFQHYTSVPLLVSMILGESMWLTRGDSISLDDSQESKSLAVGKNGAEPILVAFLILVAKAQPCGDCIVNRTPSQ